MLVRFEGDALGHEFIHDCKMTKNAAVNCFGEQYAPIDLSLLKSCQPVHHIVMVQKRGKENPKEAKGRESSRDSKGNQKFST